EARRSGGGEQGVGSGSGPQAGGGGKGALKRQTLEELVVVLAKLVLTDEAQLRAMLGAVYDTYLTPLDAAASQRMFDEGASFNTEAGERRQKIAEAGKKGETLELPKMCAPFLRTFTALLDGLLDKDEAYEADGTLKASRKPLKTYWDQKVMTIKSPNEPHDTVRYCRVQRLKTKSAHQHEQVKIQFLLDTTTADGVILLQAIRAALVEQGAEKTIGGAPRGVLVREAQRLLDQMK
ncbi:unnamed protein product, partial [Prorocentrum cordatum]